jgi:hypothetical protein
MHERKYADATRVLTATLDGYKTANPEVWERYSTQSALGASLAAQDRRAEAEPLLVGSHQGLVKLTSRMPRAELHHLDDAARALADLRKTGPGTPAPAR